MTRIRSRFATALFLGVVACAAVAAQTRSGEVAAAIPPSGPTADWVAQYGCSEVKSWSHAGVQQAFSSWSQRIAGSGARDAAAEIATNGNIGALLGNLPDLLSLMDAALELTQGDPAAAGDKILGLTLDGSAAALGGPGAAAYTIVKQMGSLADALDQEILAINVRNYAEASVDDLTLLDIDRYLNDYLHWTEPSVAGVSALEMNRRRGMLYAYATRSLGHSSFPAYLDWSQQTNLIRATAASFLAEVRGLREIYSHQRHLSQRVPALVAEVQTVRDFQAFWTAIQNLSCQDPTLDACEERLPRLAAIVALGEGHEFQPYSGANLAGPQTKVDAFDALLDELVQQNLEEAARIETYCAQSAGWLSAAERVPRARRVADQVSALAASAETQRALACEAEDAVAARQGVQAATRSASEAERLADGLRPEDYRDRLELGGISESDIHISSDRARSALDDAEILLKRGQYRQHDLQALVREADPILQTCIGRTDAGPLEDLRARLISIRIRANAGWDEAFAAYEAMRSQYGAAYDRRSEVLAQQVAGRACLSTTPDFSTGLIDLRELHASSAADSHRAGEAARAAQRCLESMPQAAPLSGDRPGEPMIPPPLPPVELELTFPAGFSPKVFTTGWIFGARARLVSTEETRDLSDSVIWSGSGSFSPHVGAISRPVFAQPGLNTIILSVEVEGQIVRQRFEVNAIRPRGYAGVGDQAMVPADGHGAPADPLPAIGPIITGSPTVLVGGRPAARVGDSGVHAICSGPNTFEIVAGDPEVLIDGRPAARMGDRTQHCGGVGTIVSAGTTLGESRVGPEEETDPGDSGETTDGWQTGERSDDPSNGWGAGERTDVVDPCAGPRPEYQQSLGRVRAALEQRDLDALVVAVRSVRPECPGDAAQLTRIRDSAVAIAQQEASNNEQQMRDDVRSGRARRAANSAAWASALGTLTSVLDEVARANTGGVASPPAAPPTSSTPSRSGGTVTPDSRSSSQKKQCLVDSHTQFEPPRSGVTYTYYIAESPVPGAGIPGYKIIQWSSRIDGRPPNGAGRKYHGPHPSVSAANGALDRLCPPAVRATDSLRLN